jgi:serine/threonine protein kinase/tetratricopeptide (TPR) repeat protein
MPDPSPIPSLTTRHENDPGLEHPVGSSVSTDAASEDPRRDNSEPLPPRDTPPGSAVPASDTPPAEASGESEGGTAWPVTRAESSLEAESKSSVPWAPARPLPSLPGYELLGELGRGGMGVVYKARHKSLNRLVALKMIRSASARKREVQRFRAEAEAVAQLQHPNIVQVYEVGECEGLPFFSLEYVEGGSLENKIAGATLPAAQAAALVQTLAQAMHAAHQRGIVHRDLKPANILLQRKTAQERTKTETRRSKSEARGLPSRSSSSAESRNARSEKEVGESALRIPEPGLLLEEFEPKIADFGLAKQLDDESGQTRAGDIMGTPSYMAPEQAWGRIKDIGPWTDTYALGAILYALLTGRPPFKGPNTLETIAQVREQEPVRPRQLQPKVPRDLETICLKCLRKEHGQRYATAAALAEDLGRFLRHEPIYARPVPPWERAIKWARRRPAVAAGAGMVVLAVLASFVGAIYYGLYKEQLAAGLQRQVELRRSVDGLWSQGQDAEARGRLEEAAEKLDRALATLEADPEATRSELYLRIAGQRERLRRLLDEQAARQQLQAREKQFYEARDQVLFHELSPTRQERSAGRAQIRKLAPAALAPWGLAENTTPEAAAGALAGFERLPGSAQQGKRIAAGCYEVLLAWAESEAEVPPGELAAGKEARLRRALRLLTIAEALGRAHGLLTPQALYLRRARYLGQLGDEKAARAESVRAAQVRPSTGLDFFLAALDSWLKGDSVKAAGACAQALEKQPDHFWAQYLQALCFFQAQRWAEAEVGLTACVARQPGYLWPRLFRATVRAELGQSDAATADFALALGQATDPFSRYIALTNRSAFLIHEKKWDGALADLEAAIRLRPEAYQAYMNLAELHRRRKQWPAALDALGKALDRRPEEAGLYFSRALVYLETKDPDAARRDFQQVLAHEPRGSRSDRLIRALLALAQLRQQAKDLPAALARCQEALRLRPDHPQALRQQAEVLLALRRYADASQALERYSKGRKIVAPEVYLAQGLIHTKLGEYPQAIEAYTLALRARPDAATLGHRGWVYLRLKALPAALKDFKAALRLDPRQTHALCGQAHTLLSEGRVRDGLADGEKALKLGPKNEQLLLDVACLFSRGAGIVIAGYGGPGMVKIDAYQFQDRAVQLLREALEQVPATRRAAFWRENIAAERALDPIRRSDGMRRLELQYGQRPPLAAGAGG